MRARIAAQTVSRDDVIRMNHERYSSALFSVLSLWTCNRLKLHCKTSHILESAQLQPHLFLAVLKVVKTA